MPPHGPRTADVNRFRAAVTKMLPGTCTIQIDATPQAASDGMGGFVQSWTSLGTFPCRIDPSRSLLLDVKGEQQTLVVYLLLTVEYGTPLGINYRVIHNGNTYQIRTLLDDLDSLIYKQARIARVE